MALTADCPRRATGPVRWHLSASCSTRKKNSTRETTTQQSVGDKAPDDAHRSHRNCVHLRPTHGEVRRSALPGHQRQEGLGMVKLTYIARALDAHPLAEGLEMDTEGLDVYKRQGKAIVSSISRQMRESYGNRPDKVSADAGLYMFHYMISDGVVYMTLAEKTYPRALAFEYLEELRSEFTRLYGAEVEQVSKPYAFVKFDTFIQRTRKLYLDHRTHRNLQKLQGTLQEVHQVMTQNINDILGQGAKLDRMTEMSSMLSQESKAYHKKAKDMYWNALVRKYVPFIVLGSVVILVLLIRWKFYT